MKLIKFNFLTLIFSVLITLNVGVAGSLCTPDNDEFDDRIVKQEGENPELQVEDIPTKNDFTAVSKNIANTTAETTEALDGAIMDTALLTAETAVEVIGVIGVVITVGLMIYHIVEVFENPKSTTMDKILSFIDSSLVYNIFAAFGPSPGDRIEAKVDKQLKAIDNIGEYESPDAEIRDMVSFVSKIESSLKLGMDNTADLEKIYSEHGRELSIIYMKQYFKSIKKLQELLTKTYSLQWMKGSPKFIALDEFLDHSIKGITTTPPSILSTSTLALCGINDSSNHTLVLKNMNPKQIQECLGDIFYDYKAHFSAYKLDDMITIKSPDGTEGITDIKKFDISKLPHTESDKSYSLSKFLGSYVKTYNYFLSNLKISYANAFYKQRKQGRGKICSSMKDTASKFLERAKIEAQKMTKKMFRERYGLNNSGQNMNKYCWDYTAKYAHPHYDCTVVPYKPKKDEILITTLEGINNLFLFIDSRVEECLDGQSDSYVEFAKFLKNERISETHFSPTWRFFKPSLNSARTRFKEITSWVKIGFCQSFLFTQRSL
jgi:hypothetical protein